mmetsp:Transcript_100641/g.285158  ORF Transcript_100641/g.285158 Transcript_100641/m.285158 type:complete len:438 (+) Transcript_100641:103-1416(+)
MEDRSTVRTNGFERPFHPLQVLSWVVFGSDVFIYIVFCMPLIETTAAKVLVALFYVTSVIVLVLATIKATSCDPADPHVRHQASDLKADDSENLPYCTMCNVPVYSRSKHCRACNKCVTTFDHHCMWLNNCIGAANYRAFFVTVSSVAIMIGIVLGTCLYLLIDYFVNEDMFASRVEDIAMFRSIPKEFFLGLLIVMLSINVPLFVLDMQLVILHAFLSSQDLTTYEYIMSKRAQQEPQDADEGAEKASRFRQRIRTLPHCMDWIVFSRCGQRRRPRKKPKNGVERVSNLDVDAEAGKTEVGPREANRPVAASPTPPGSTAEEPGEPTTGTSQQVHGANEQGEMSPAGAGARSSGSDDMAGDAASLRPDGQVSPGPKGKLQVGGLHSTEVSEQKAFESGDAMSSHTESQGVVVASKIGCGCDGGTRPCDKQSAPSKV